MIQKDSKELSVSRVVIFFEDEIATQKTSDNVPCLVVEKMPEVSNDELREENESGNSSIVLYDSSIEDSVQNSSNGTFTDAVNSTVVNVNDASNSDDSVVSTIDDHRADPNSQAQVMVEPSDRMTRGIMRFLNPFGGYWNFAFRSIADALGSSESDRWKLALQDRRPIKSKWVFKKKTDANGNVVRYKARLVVKGRIVHSLMKFNDTILLVCD